MHRYTDLIDRSTSFTLSALREAQQRAEKRLEVGAQTADVKALQMVSLQKAIMAVGMFSLAEAIWQDRRSGKEGSRSSMIV